MYKRQSGVLLPVFSLPGPYGCGCFGESAFHWIDRIKEAGFSIWQVLPFGMTDDNNSPYMSYSSFGGNPFFIDPDALYDQGLVTLEELRSQMVDYPYLCRYGILNDSRIGFLKKAASRVKDHAPIRKFMKENPFIDGTCRFLALKEKNSGKKWIDLMTMLVSVGILWLFAFTKYYVSRREGFILILFFACYMAWLLYLL